MDIRAFFKALSAKCGKGMCEECGARKFCFTTPHSMTNEIIDKTIEWINGPGEGKP